MLSDRVGVGRVPASSHAVPLPPAQAGEEMAASVTNPPPLAGEGRAAERGQDSEGAERGAKRAFADPIPPQRADGEPAIRAHNLSKCYLIYDRPQDRLKQSIVPRLRRLIGKPPHTYYREFWALRDLSFEVRKGETFGIIGRNGAGKSTLLQILSGTLHPNSGSVTVTGRIAALLELGSGFNPEFSGRENVYLYASVLGLSRHEVDDRFDDIAAFADIGDFINQPIKTYSTGMVVRLAFAVIVHVDADILVIDEALAVGDAFFVQKCMRFLRGFMEKGTILFVSHDTGLVINLCQRAMWLQDGAIRALGPPKEVAEAYLADLYEAHQGPSAVRNGAARPPGRRTTAAEPRDQRLAYLNHSKLRNDIELFRFDPASPGFGKGGATIVYVELRDSDGERLGWCVGGEDVALSVRCEAHVDISAPIVGFIVKDRLGQPLFSDNTCLTYMDSPLCIKAGERFEAVFRFRMPILPMGDYSICAAVAEGTQMEHLQHHWIHDAILFKSHSSSVCTGLVGIPMQDIQLRKI
jgi:lipopolysaccharide transport system ATP-binding protein